MRSLGEESSCEMPGREPGSHSCRDLKVRSVNALLNSRKRHRKGGRGGEVRRRRGGLEAADARCDRGSTSSLSVDDSEAHSDCTVCLKCVAMNPLW